MGRVGGAGAQQVALEAVDTGAEGGAAAQAAPEAQPDLAVRTQRAASGSFQIAALVDRLQAGAGAEPAGTQAATQAAPPTGPAASALPSTVRRGSTGADVEALQRQLNAERAQAGLPPIKVDGIFGPETEGAVKALQQAKGLAQDGIAGPLTWGALGGAGTTPAPDGPGAATTPGGARPSTPATTGPSAPPTGPTTSHAAGSAHPRGPQSVRQEAVWTRLQMPGRISVSEMPSNGGRPVAVYVPQNLDPSRPVNVVTLFHGHNSSVGEGFERNGLLPNRMRELEQQHPNTVFVFPQAGAKPFSYWMKPPRESMAALEQQALGEAARMAGVPSLEVGRRVVSAHSGGGLALKNAVQAGQMRADSIEFLDCTYGDWGQTVARWAQRQPEGQRPRIESWHTSGDTANHDVEIERIAPQLFTAHRSPVGHSAIPSRFLGATLP